MAHPTPIPTTSPSVWAAFCFPQLTRCLFILSPEEANTPSVRKVALFPEHLPNKIVQLYKIFAPKKLVHLYKIFRSEKLVQLYKFFAPENLYNYTNVALQMRVERHNLLPSVWHSPTCSFPDSWDKSKKSCPLFAQSLMHWSETKLKRLPN